MKKGYKWREYKERSGREVKGGKKRSRWRKREGRSEEQGRGERRIRENEGGRGKEEGEGKRRERERGGGKRRSEGEGKRRGEEEEQGREVHLKRDDQSEQCSDGGEAVPKDDSREPEIEQWHQVFPLESVAELLEEEGPHYLRKVGRLDQGTEVHDGGDGGKDSDKDVESFKTDHVVLITATF